MLYTELAQTYQKLESTSLKLQKTRILAEFLENTKPEDIEKVSYLTLGRVFPGWSELELGVASLLMAKALAKAYGAKPADITKDWAKTGDLGLVAERLASKKKQNSLFKRQLTVEKVFDNLRKLPGLSGAGSQEKKLLLISELFSQAGPLEARYVARTVIGDLRIGVGEGILRDAVCRAFLAVVEWESSLMQKSAGKRYYEEIFESKNKSFAIESGLDKTLEEDNKKIYEKFKSENKVSVVTKTEISKIAVLSKKKSGIDYIFVLEGEFGSALKDEIIATVDSAYEVSNDYGVVAKTVAEKGLAGLRSLAPEIGRPIKVMLAQKVAGVDEAFETVGKPCFLEYKYDGFRLQGHKNGDTVTLFTRRLENVTKQFPEIAELIKECVKAESCIIEGEAVGFDPKTKKYLPFQMISRRIKRKYDITETAKGIPIVLNLFDIIYLNGRSMLNTPFAERRKALEQIVKETPEKMVLAKQLSTDSQKEAERFYKEALDKGNEGVMFKSLNAPYKPGSRVGHMIKLKPTMESLDLTIAGAEWGEGKRAGWLSSFILACMDRETGEFKEIGRMGTGIKEKAEEGTSFGELTEMLKKHIIKEKGKVVEIRPSIVVEVAYEEIQKSPTYSSGYALRFPRLLRLRPDRTPEDVDDISRVEELYNFQRRRGK